MHKHLKICKDEITEKQRNNYHFFNYKTVKNWIQHIYNKSCSLDKFSLRSLKRILKQYITSFQLWLTVKVNTVSVYKKFILNFLSRVDKQHLFVFLSEDNYELYTQHTIKRSMQDWNEKKITVALQITS